MQFEQWLIGRNRGAVAVQLGVHRMTINRYARGEIMPRPDMTVAIGKLTGGIVTDEDLRTAYSTYWVARR